MQIRLGLFLFVLSMGVFACSTEPSSPPSSQAPPSSPTSVVTTVPSTSTTAPPSPCPAPPYEVGSLPLAVEPAGGDTESVPDEFASIGGTNSTLWVGTDGDVAIALIRGTLPPSEFPGEKGEVEVGGSRAVAGAYPDGRWVVAWFNEPGERCDEYTMVFYPPVSPAEVEDTLKSMERVAG